jgi:hypothetical protein
MLRRAVTPQRDGSHLPLLFALRQVRDPQMRPLLLQLARKPDWQMQVHAALGLAEIDPNRQVDPWMITQLSEEAQDAVVATALDMKMLPAERIGEVLAWDQLHAMARMFLLAELQMLKQPVDAAELTKLAAAEDHYVSGLASALLAHSGNADALAAWEKRLAARPSAEQTVVAIWLIDACRRYELTGLSGWIAGRGAAADGDPDLAYRATFALLMLDPRRGCEAWLAYLGEAPSFSLRVRSGVMLLSTGGKAPTELYDRLLPAGKDEDLIARIVDVGKAMGGDASPAMIALLDLGHPKTSMWAMDHLAAMPPEQSRKVYEHLIDRMREPQAVWTDGIAQAVQATSRLAEIDLDAVLERLRNAEDDSAVQQSILLGLFESSEQRVGEAAAALPRVGSGRADSLALLLHAKHASTLDDARRRQLGVIAAGGGRVSEILQVQAAWLYLRHTGQIDQALATVFAKAPSE